MTRMLRNYIKNYVQISNKQYYYVTNMQNSFIFYEIFITCFHLFHPTGQQQYTTYSFFS